MGMEVVTAQNIRINIFNQIRCWSDLSQTVTMS